MTHTYSLGLDFDGTLCNSDYPNIGGPIQPVIDYALKKKEQGWKLILITMREGKVLEQAIEWCKEQGLEFDSINDNLPEMKAFYKNNPRKIYCTEYIDDHNVVIQRKANIGRVEKI